MIHLPRCPRCAGRFDRQKGDLGACTPCARKECKTPVVIYNLLQVMRAYVAASQVEMPVDAVSVEQIFVDVQKELTGMALRQR